MHAAYRTIPAPVEFAFSNVFPYAALMPNAKAPKKPRKSSGRLRGAAVAAKQAPKVCKIQLSSCMKGGGRKVAGTCMRQFHRCKTATR